MLTKISYSQLFFANCMDYSRIASFLHIPSKLIHFSFNFIERIEKPMRSYSWAHQQKAKHIPSEHVPPRCIGAFNAHFYGFCLYLLSNPRHPDKRVNE